MVGLDLNFTYFKSQLKDNYTTREIKPYQFEKPKMYTSLVGTPWLSRMSGRDLNDTTLEIVKQTLHTFRATVAYPTVYEFSFNHNLGYKPVVEGTYSVDDDNTRILVNSSINSGGFNGSLWIDDIKENSMTVQYQFDHASKTKASVVLRFLLFNKEI